MAVNPFDFSKNKKAVIETGTESGIDGDDNFIGTNYSDTLFAGKGNDVLAGGNGDDVLHGGEGNDLIWGDSVSSSSANDNGQDILFGDAGSDSLHGGNAKDVLYGGVGNDVLYGENGSDLLQGDGGYDVLIGGNGPDTFKYTAITDSAYTAGAAGTVAANPWVAPGGSNWDKVWDVITDFVSGTDNIDLTPLNSQLSGGGLTKLTWTGATETDAQAGVANAAFAHRVWSDTDGKFIYADTNGDGIADLKVQVHAGAGDFIGVNHAPTSTADSNAGDPVTEAGVNPGNTVFTGDPTASGNVLTNDTDSDGDVLKVVAVHAGANPDTAVPADNSDVSIEGTYGTLVIHKDGTYTYTLSNSDGDTNALAQNEAAADTFTYTVSDPYGATASTTLTINIAGTNDGPTAVADNATTDEDTAVDIDVVANDTDPDHGHILSVSAVDATSANGATVTLNGDGTVNYDPTTALNHLAQGASVDDTFSYTVTDEFGATSTAIVTVHVDGVNDGPTAVADSASTNEDSAIAIDVVANDTDPDDGHTLSVSAVDATSANGVAVTLNGDGTVNYDPTTALNHLAQGDSVDDTFSYTVTDEFGATSTATVTVHVAGVNDGPTAVADSASTNEDSAIAIDVVANDTDPDDGHTLSVSAVDATSANGASVTLNGDGTVNYDPTTALDHLAEGDSVDDTFSYTVTDEFGATSTATVTVHVAGVNDGPTAVADSASTNEDSAIAIDVVANDTDPDDGHILSVSTFDLTSANGASVTLNGDGTVNYDPTTALDHLAEGDSVDDTFSYTVTDEFGATSTATVTVHVAGVNDGPTAVADSASTNEDSAIAIDVVANDTDPDDGHILSVSTFDLTSANGATITLNGDGTLNYDPTTSATLSALNNGGSIDDTFSYTVTDEHGATSTTTVTVHVDGVTDGGGGGGPPPGDPHGPTGIVLDLSGAQSGNNLPDLGKFVGTGDTPGDTYTWSIAPGADSHIVVGADGTLTATGIDPGTYTFTVTATDPDAIANPSASATFTLLVGTTGGGGDTMPSAPTYVLSATNNIEVGLGGDDHLTGSAGVDYILGSGNDDVIKGLGGADVLSGGTGGKDTYVYTSASDSLVGSGDKIYQFDGGTTGNHDTLDFHLLGITAANVTVTNSAGNTIVQANTDGSPGADMEITLVGVTLDQAHLSIAY